MNEYFPETHTHTKYTMVSHEAVCSIAALLHAQGPSGVLPHGTLGSLAKQIHENNPTRSLKTAQNLVSIAWKCARHYQSLLEIYRTTFVELPEAYRGAASDALSKRLKSELDSAGYQHHHRAIDEYLSCG